MENRIDELRDELNADVDVEA